MLESWRNGNNFPYRHTWALNFSLQCIISSSDLHQILARHVPVDAISGRWVNVLQLGAKSTSRKGLPKDSSLIGGCIRDV